jgi:hypothetical protein
MGTMGICMMNGREALIPPGERLDPGEPSIQFRSDLER